MAYKATINSITIPYTGLKCPECSKEFEEKAPLTKIEKGNKNTRCSKCGEPLQMEIFKTSQATKIKVSKI